MAAAGLTRCYNHFKTKGDLYAMTLVAYAQGREEAAADTVACGPALAWRICDQYVSREHLDNVDGQCPLMALPSDAARAGPTVRAAYQRVLEALVEVFETNVGIDSKTGAKTGHKTGGSESARQQGLAIAATCVGSMVLARTIEDAELADEICAAARALAADEFGHLASSDAPGASGLVSA